jgi:hypothetical protein
MTRAPAPTAEQVTGMPDDPLSFEALGCRGVLRLLVRAAYYQICERLSPAFLWAYARGYRLCFVVVLRRVSPQRAHETTPRVMAWLDDHCPTWLLTLISDLAFGSARRQARRAREAAEKKAQQEE